MGALRQDYAAFLAAKAPAPAPSGLEGPLPALSPRLFPHQRDCVAFGLRQGRWGCFLDTGLGKTAVQLEWCRHAAAAANGRALILAPLAVAGQIAREAAAFGIEARVVRDRAEVGPGVNVCNYDRLDRLDPAAFGAVALDESSVLKSFTGRTTRALIEAFRHTRFRMCATATPAPNDHMELGQHAEFLGVMPANEMLMRWFTADQTEMGRYRLKRHGETAFWDWMAGWCRMAETPADLGHDASAWALPALRTHRHRAIGDVRPAAGALFAAEVSATTVFETKRRTSQARAAMAMEVAWSMWMTAANGGEHTCGHTVSHTPRSGSEPPSSGPPSTPGAGNSTPPIPSAGSEPAITPPKCAGSGRTTTRTGSCATPSVSACRTTVPYSTLRTGPAQSVDHGPQAEPAGTSTSITATTPAVSVGCSARAATSASASSETTRRTLSALRATFAGARTPALVLWCDTNDEQDALEREFGDTAFSIRGSMTAEAKERLHDAWLRGERPALITKSSIFGFGMNWQHCAAMIFAGRSFSYEAWYQAVRRCWRFGQTRPVDCHLIVAEAEDQIGRVVERKAADHARMKAAMSAAMRRAAAAGPEHAPDGLRVPYAPNHIAELPTWL